jgi:hypothetical protein
MSEESAATIITVVSVLATVVVWLLTVEYMDTIIAGSLVLP